MMNFIWFLITVGIIWFLFKWIEKKKESSTPGDAKSKDPQYVQDLFDYEDIDSNGLISLKDGTYALVIDVVPIKMNMKNQSEKDSVWFNYRSLVNSLPTHCTFLLQSQYLDMTDYIDDYISTANNPETASLTPQLQASADDVGSFLKRQYSERKTRDYKGYVIIRYNPFSQGTESGVSTGNSNIDTLIKQIKGEATLLPKDEAEELAQNMMDEVAALVYQSFDSFRCRVSRLNKEGVLGMLHQTLNRDLANYESIGDLYDNGAFSNFKQSLTPHYSNDIADQEEVS